MIFLTNYKEYNLTKDIFLSFVRQFNNSFKSDLEFITYHKNILEQHPQLTHYAYQYALEISFETKILDSRQIERVFEKKFKIVDTYGMNGGECDISTLNTAFVLNDMVKYSPFKNLTMRIMNAPLSYQTPLYYHIQGQSPVKDLVTRSRISTGQSNADCMLGDRIYDIKHTTSATTKLNHILPWTFDRVEQDGAQHLNNVYSHLKKGNTYSQDLAEELDEIRKNASTSIHEKFNEWNEFLLYQWKNLEKEDITVPIVHQITNTPFEKLESRSWHEKIRIPHDVLENKEVACKALANIALAYGDKCIKNAEKATNGILSTKTAIDPMDDVD